MLLVNELVSNANSSGAHSHAVVLEVSQDSVRVALEDMRADQQELSTATWVPVFDQLADEWGCDPGPVGTSVWFTLGRPGR